uniref:Saposin B-type domain-containing protein n=2 Tax=Chromera velia CCMP2878 TaxID=1169474 RepID=A0A0G4FQT6_9ALVE|eukprot:Cvel_18225.t1-p1 / transcript=Cvel_18225.t1 / gene=Cvel_18225 / organism=Chromera_velia_CCMP2878 / gene_product=hypothetical protein / transcript_product=hypothetical protein / location=Cvel_scaffold1497:36396-44145(+) / protein_length=623 / sequence_SO=supercontig / SO=protein_coding / is_pseudo=false
MRSLLVSLVLLSGLTQRSEALSLHTSFCVNGAAALCDISEKLAGTISYPDDEEAKHVYQNIREDPAKWKNIHASAANSPQPDALSICKSTKKPRKADQALGDVHFYCSDFTLVNAVQTYIGKGSSKYCNACVKVVTDLLGNLKGASHLCDPSKCMPNYDLCLQFEKAVRDDGKTCEAIKTEVRNTPYEKVFKGGKAPSGMGTALTTVKTKMPEMDDSWVWLKNQVVKVQGQVNAYVKLCKDIQENNLDVTEEADTMVLDYKYGLSAALNVPKPLGTALRDVIDLPKITKKGHMFFLQPFFLDKEVTADTAFDTTKLSDITDYLSSLITEELPSEGDSGLTEKEKTQLLSKLSLLEGLLTKTMNTAPLFQAGRAVTEFKTAILKKPLKPNEMKLVFPSLIEPIGEPFLSSLKGVKETVAEAFEWIKSAKNLAERVKVEEGTAEEEETEEPQGTTDDKGEAEPEPEPEVDPAETRPPESPPAVPDFLQMRRTGRGTENGGDEKDEQISGAALKSSLESMGDIKTILTVSLPEKVNVSLNAMFALGKEKAGPNNFGPEPLGSMLKGPWAEAAIAVREAAAPVKEASLVVCKKDPSKCYATAKPQIEYYQNRFGKIKGEITHKLEVE